MVSRGLREGGDIYSFYCGYSDELFEKVFWHADSLIFFFWFILNCLSQLLCWRGGLQFGPPQQQVNWICINTTASKPKRDRLTTAHLSMICARRLFDLWLLTLDSWIDSSCFCFFYRNKMCVWDGVQIFAFITNCKVKVFPLFMSAILACYLKFLRIFGWL